MNETLTNNSYYSLSIPTDGYASIQDLGIKLDGSNEFCIEAWVLLNGMGIDISIVKRNEVFTFGISHGKLYLMIGQDTIFSDGETHVTSRKWHHVAVYYDLFTLKFYVNGIPDGNTSIQLTTQDKGTTYLLGENLDGRIRSLRIYNRAIDLDTLLSEMYTPTDITELCTDFDFSSNPPVNHKNPNQEIELNGRARITEAVPALYLEGTAYAQPTLCKNINPGGKQIDPYTLQIFFYISKNQFHQTIFVNGSHDSDAGIALYLRYSSEEKSYRLCCLRGTDTKQENKLFSQTLIHSNTWNNVAITYDGQTTILYINGEKDVTDEKASPILTRMNEGNVLIGGMLESGKPTGTNTFQGYIQRIDIWDKALTADEISNYSKDVPKSASDGLVECFDFTNEPFRGYKTDVPIAVCDGAQFKELITDAPQNVKEYNPVQTSINVNYKLPIQARENFDISFHHSQIHERFNMEAVGVNELFAVLEKDVENEDIELLRRRGQLMSSRKDFLLGVTHHQEGMDYILIAHYYSESIPICRCSVVDIDDCLLRIIELIYLLIGGAITAIFGIKTRLTPEAINFIRMYILSIPAINVLIAKGTEMKATDVYQLGHILYTEGVLKALVRTMVSLGFWLLMRLLSKLVLTFLGVGWVDTIAALVATAITFTIKIVDYITHCLPLPAIAIEEIWFDHPDGINDSHSLHIRKNKGLQIQYPEWTSLRSEPVAYALTQINNRTIKAKFVIHSPFLYDAEIHGVAAQGNPFGDFAIQHVQFLFGTSGDVTFNVIFPAAHNIGQVLATWNWQYRRNATDTWKNMGSTTHTIYLLQNLPVAPWSQALNQKELWPWSDALKLSSAWLPAVLPATTANLAAQFTTGIINSGLNYYGCGSQYINAPACDTFKLSSVIQNIQLTGILNVTLECSDCAFLLTVISRLWGTNIPLNPVLFQDTNNKVKTSFLTAIGYSPASISNWNTHEWGYHVIARNGIGQTSSVYDCCLRLKGDNDPWTMPATPPPAIIPGGTGTPMVQGVLTLQKLNVPYPIMTDYYDRLFDNNKRTSINETVYTITNIE